MSVNKSGRTLVLFRKNNLDAFVAAFIYWWLFGKDSVRPTDTIIADAPKINFKTVDVFENVHQRDFTFKPWSPKIQGYIGTGDTLLSVGINLAHVPAASMFFSYENDTTFERTYHENEHIVPIDGEMPEGCQYFYDPRKKLTELMLESLIAAKHLTTSDKNFIVLNQFFQFVDGKSEGFKIHDAVAEKLLTYFPLLRVEDFKELSVAITDPLSFMEGRRKRTPEDAVRENERRRLHQAFDLASKAEAYERQTGIELYLVNSDQALSELGPLYLKDNAAFIYRMVPNGVRGHYFSSSQGENALRVFPEGRPVIGNERQAEWFITLPDFYSLIQDLPSAP